MPGLVPLLRELASLAVGLGLLAPLAHGLLHRLPASIGAPTLVARLQAAEQRGGAGEEAEAGPVLHLLPEAAHDQGARALIRSGPDHPAAAAARRGAVPCPDGSCAVRGRTARP